MSMPISAIAGYPHLPAGNTNHLWPDAAFSQNQHLLERLMQRLSSFGLPECVCLMNIEGLVLGKILSGPRGAIIVALFVKGRVINYDRSSTGQKRLYPLKLLSLAVAFDINTSQGQAIGGAPL